MNRDDFYYLGKITKTSGYSGSLMFFFDVDDISYYNDLEAVFVDIGGDLVPFAVHSINIKDNKSAFVKLEDVDNEEQAAALAGKELYLPLSYLPPLTGNNFYFHEVTGFNIKDTKRGIIGVIDNVTDSSGQGLFVIKHKGKEILIPVSDEFIKKVDRENAVIEVDLPDGLIELYL